MAWIVRSLWLIPALPLLAAGIAALLRREQRKVAAALAIGSISLSFALAMVIFAGLLRHPQRLFFNFRWLQFGGESVTLGWVLDPLAAVMLVMVSFVGLLVFVYSLGYMRQDENFTRFFCFLALFAGAMLGLVIANSLLLLFMCWEVVGLTSYLLIGFWYERPAAAAAAKKAFITTRIGDLGLLLGMVWLYGETGTLLFYDHGAGCLENPAISLLAAHGLRFGIAASTAIALLIFCGAVGKSGQLPLHAWLPDAMEGPTPVSALIHAATMVAAGVYLVARVYPLMRATRGFEASPAAALQVVVWVGALTAVFAALAAVAQDDIKRVLAYSTISQLGYMMIGIGVGGVAVGLFHLLAHAFFKALLFLGAGSVIHGCGNEQDMRKMGGLRKWMPITFLTYAAGTLALCGFPLFFSGFWSKDAILHAAHGWNVSRGPFYLGAAGALLTAFYMTRQVCYVFFGSRRADESPERVEAGSFYDPSRDSSHDPSHDPHESPRVMTAPLVLLAAFAIFLGFVGTPAWPWLQAFLDMRQPVFDLRQFAENGFLQLLLTSSVLVFAGLGLGWWLYGSRPIASSSDVDILERWQPTLFRAMRNGFYGDQIYALTVQRWMRQAASFSGWLDRWVWSGAPRAVSALARGFGRIDSSLDRRVVNQGFDEGCNTVAACGRLLSRVQNRGIQNSLRLVGAGVAALALFLLFRHRG